MKRFAAALVITALCGLPLKADSPINFMSASLTTAVTVKNTAGSVYGFSITNATAAACYVQIFNATAANVTLGTTVPILSIGLGPGATTTNMYGPILFNVAISAAATTTANGGTPCAAGETVNLLYL